MTKRLGALAGAIAAGAIVFPEPGFAAVDGNFALEEVVVNAQKREESLQDTPISITAFGPDRLETDGIVTLQDISAKTPGVTIEPFPTTATTLIIYIRGVGVEDVQMTQDPSVGIYLDGVYLARSSGTALDLTDLQQIEVLRGPQGTLYGRNTTGGAFNITSVKPSTDARSVKQKFSFGDRNLMSSKTSINQPIGDSAAVKLALLKSKQDGFIENTGPGGDFGDRDTSAWRLDFLWDASDSLSMRYAYDNSDIDHYNYEYQALNRPTNPKGTLDLVKHAAERRTIYSRDRFDKMATGAPLEENSTNMEGHSFNLTKEFENSQLRYIFARRELLDRAYYEFGGGAGSTEFRLDSNYYDGIAATGPGGLGGPVALQYNTITQQQTSHEIQFSGLWRERLHYVVGGYVFEESGSDVYPFRLLTRLPLNAVNDPDPGPGENNVLVVFQEFDIDVESEAWAAFFQATWTPPILDDRLKITVGFRHSVDDRAALKSQFTRSFAENTTTGVAAEADNTTGALPLPPDFDAIPTSKQFKDDSFSFVLEYELTENINIYAKAVDSYKSGGFNIRDPQVGKTGDPATDDSDQAAADGNVYGFGYVDGFDEEGVLSYELGVKAELFNRRLRINADVYQSLFNDRQMNFIIDTTISDSKVTNAGEAEAAGLDLELTWLATENLLFFMNYAYLDTDVTEVKDAFGNDRTDDFEFFSAPMHTATASFDFTVLRSDRGNLVWNVSYNYMDERNGDSRSFTNGQQLRDSFELYNTRLSWNGLPLLGGSLNAALWMKNVLDEEYYVAGTTSLPQANQVALWGEPRMFGLDLIYTWEQ